MTHHRFAGLPAPGSSYSVAVETSGRRLLHVSGQLPIRPDGSGVSEDSMTAQAAQIFENLLTIARERGATLRDAVKITYYCADLTRFAEVRAVRERYLEPPYPAATAIGVQGLLGGFLLEVEMILELPDPGTGTTAS